jgi:hypothetical protein
VCGSPFEPFEDTRPCPDHRSKAETHPARLRFSLRAIQLSNAFRREAVQTNRRSPPEAGVLVMTTGLAAIDRLPGVRRIENCGKEELTNLAMEMTHAVYPHDEVYGQYCTVQDYVD